MRRLSAPHTERRPGQALVELAVLLPVLLIFIGVVAEFGHLYLQSTLVSGAAREGARVAATGGKDTDVSLAVSQYATGLDQRLMQIAVLPYSRTSGQEVTVTVDVPVTLTMPIVSSLIGPTLTVRGKAVMRVE